MSATEFYNHSTYPATGAQGSSAALRAELELIEAGFGKLPDLSGNGSKIVAINSGATAMEAITTTGTGSGVRATSPTLVTPILGTPTSGTLTNCTGLPVSAGISGLGANVATALAVAVGTDGAFVVKGGALGTPSSGVLTGLTGAVPTAAQPNITSVGTLTSLAVSGSATIGDASATRTVVIDGIGSGGGGGAYVGVKNAGSFVALLGNYSAVAGGAYDATPTLYSTSTLRVYAGATVGLWSSTGLVVTGDVGNGVVTTSNNIIAETNANGNSEVALNYYGYQKGTTQFRDTSIYDGKNTLLWRATGSTGAIASAGSYTARNATAIPAGGTAGAGLMVSSTANFGVFFGSGAPTLSAAKGSLYLRSDGSGTTDRAYINTNGTTTWTAVTTVA